MKSFSQTFLKKFSKTKIDENICSARHTHSAVSWKNYVVISGGLDSNENPLNDIILFNEDTNEMKKIQLKKGFIFPRYYELRFLIVFSFQKVFFNLSFILKVFSY